MLICYFIMPSLENNNQRGFSLIELSMVLFILTLLLGGLLMPLSIQQESRERRETKDHLNKIRDSIYGFVLSYYRLPCPDNNGDGKEDVTGGDCDDVQGTLPWSDLGVKGEDAWQQAYTYRVRDEYADDEPGTGCDTPNNPDTPGVSFALCSKGNITVQNGDGDDVAQNLPAIIISHGRNATENNPSPDEQSNQDNDSTFIIRDYDQQDNQEFDDIVIWISPHVLRHKMLEAGILP